MADRREIAHVQTEERTVTITEKLDPKGQKIVEKIVEWHSNAIRSDQNFITGQLDFLHQITHENLIQIESYKVTSTESPIRLAVYMEPAVMNADQLIESQQYSPWGPDELVVQLDGLVSVLAHTQRQNRNHCRLSLDHILVSKSFVLKLIGFATVTRGREVALARALDPLYLSPVRLEMARSQTVPQNYNEAKGDVYSLGVCILLILYACYPETKTALRNKEIAPVLQYISQYEGLHRRLSAMLTLDDQSRPDFVQLEEICKQRPAPMQLPKQGVPEPPQRQPDLPPAAKPPGLVSPSGLASPLVPPPFQKPSGPSAFGGYPPGASKPSLVSPPSNAKPSLPQPGAILPGGKPAPVGPPFPPKQFGSPVPKGGPMVPNMEPGGNNEDMGRPAPAKKPFGMRPADADVPDILGGPGVRPPSSPMRKCKFCANPFEKKHSANRADFEGQFEDFCSEDCVMQYTMRQSMN